MNPWIPGGMGLAAIGTLIHGAYLPNSPVFGEALGRGDARRRRIYLTFDDGPSRLATERIVDVLMREGVPATFFQVGRHVMMLPEIARRVAQAGHEIGNHTMSHRKLLWCGPRDIAREVSGAQNVLRDEIGVNARFFRAPHGLRNPFVTRAAGRLGLRVVGWTFGVWDSDRPGVEEIRRRVRARLKPGAIVLLHDGDGYDPAGDRSQTAAALPGIIADARDLGYEFGALGELIESAARAAADDEVNADAGRPDREAGARA